MSDSQLATMAVEVKLAEGEASLHAIAFACELEAMSAGAARSRLEYIGQKIGLSRDATGMVLDSYEQRAKLLHQAHLVLRQLIAQGAPAAVTG